MIFFVISTDFNNKKQFLTAYYLFCTDHYIYAIYINTRNNKYVHWQSFILSHI